ncbi:MAG TPA: hypothetical protein VGL94_16195 [Ktedonobacteraceae bacterium]
MATRALNHCNQNPFTHCIFNQVGRPLVGSLLHADSALEPPSGFAGWIPHLLKASASSLEQVAHAVVGLAQGSYDVMTLARSRCGSFIHFLLLPYPTFLK